MSFKELRELTGLSRAAFSREYHIPIRTIEDWESERRTPPQYVLELLEFKIRTIIVTDPSGTTLKSVGKPLADHGYKI